MFDLTFAYNAQFFHWWQLLSAHFIHYDAKHLILNLLALPLLLFVFPTKLKPLFLGFILAILLIDVYLLLSPVHVYAGFSGVLYVIPGIALAGFYRLKKYSHILLVVSFYGIYLTINSHVTNYSGLYIWTPLLPAHLIGLFSGFMARFYFESS